MKRAEMRKQPFRFLIVMANGEKIEGGCESSELCWDHLRHCLRCDPSLRCFYLGKWAEANPRELFWRDVA